MIEPTQIEAAHFFEFLGDSEVAVVFLSAHPWHAFNRSLCKRLRPSDGRRIVFGTLNLRDLLVTPSPALSFLRDGMRVCGGPTSLGILPGYWLFDGGEVVAWSAGLPAKDDLGLIARSALLGALWSGVTLRAASLGEALHGAAKEAMAQRTAAVFVEALATHAHRGTTPQAEAGSTQTSGGTSSSSSRASNSSSDSSSNAWSRWSGTSSGPSAHRRDDVSQAYETLGVHPQATDQEVKEAWRKRRREFHPDQSANDPEAFERLSRLSVEINRARDTIFQKRARAN